MLPWSTYSGTKLETADTAKEHLQRHRPLFYSERCLINAAVIGHLADSPKVRLEEMRAIPNAVRTSISSNPVSGPFPCCGQLASVKECNGDFSPTTGTIR